MNANEKTLLIKPSPSSLPWSKIILVGLILLGNSFSQVMVFPFLPFMVHDFYPDLKETQLGYKTGFLGSAFAAGSFLAAYLWGTIADHIGRKPVLLAGLCGTIVAIVMFGLSESFAWAFVCRFLWGLTNGNNGVARTYLSEIMDDANLAQAFSVIGLQRGIGGLFGPAIGGILANPAKKYHFLDNPILRRFPYLLPCLVAAFIAGVAFVGTFLFLDETLAKKQDKKSQKHSSPADIKAVPPFRLRAGLNQQEKMLKDVEEYKNNAGLIEEKREEVTLLSLLKDKNVRLTTGIYGLVAALGIMGNAIFPLWALNDAKHGGYSFNSRDIGLVYTVSAPFEVLFQLFGYSALVKSMRGPLYTLQLALLLQACCYFILPFTSLTSSTSVLVQWVTLCSNFTMMVLTRLCCFTSVFVLVSNAAPKSRRGRVNGLGETIAAAARLVSPIIASSLFAWSEENNFQFPLNFHFIFNVLTILSLIVFYMSKGLSDAINRAPKE